MDKWRLQKRTLQSYPQKQSIRIKGGALGRRLPTASIKSEDDKTQEREARFLAKFCNRKVLYLKMSPPDGVWIEASYFFGLTGDRQKPAGTLK